MLGVSSRRSRSAPNCRFCNFCNLVCAPHHSFSSLASFIRQDVSLATDEITMQLSHFLRILHTHQLVCEVECIGERFFSKRHRTLAKVRRLAIDAIDRIFADREIALKSSLILVKTLFCDFAHPIHAESSGLYGSPRGLLSELASVGEIRCRVPGHSSTSSNSHADHSIWVIVPVLMAFGANLRRLAQALIANEPHGRRFPELLNPGAFCNIMSHANSAAGSSAGWSGPT